MLTSFLLPVDNMELFQGTATLVGSMSGVLADRMNKVTLLHVMAGSYIAKHMENIDHRVEHVITSDLIRELRAKYIEESVKPELDKAKGLLKEKGVSAPIDLEIEDGSPARVIADKATQGNYSTIVMQRRGLGALEGMVMGSVTDRLLHEDITASVYLTGTSERSWECNKADILVAVDDSSHSDAALAEAAVLIGKCAEINQVVVCSVTDAASYAEAVENGKMPEKESLAVLDRAASILEASGVPSDRVEKVARYGRNPATALEEEIKNRNVNMVFMGRRGRGQLKELFMGSVSTRIINCCPEQTIVLVSA